ncbi:MAG: nitroreductase family protein [Planctomycetaceae bacterium]|jgi:nitroreductase|nr:nitroreductase family protein [Planctomycetaceae bacterium]
MMELFEAIAKRHSYRGEFQNQPIPREDLRKIVEAGIMAPSGCNHQTTFFIIVDEPDLLKNVADLIGKPVCYSAKAMIVCVADPGKEYRDISFFREDCAAAVENMLLAVTAMGYATVWLDGNIRFGVDEQIGALLGVPKNYSVRIVLPLGVPVTQGTPNKKLSFEKRAWFNGYEKE